MSRRAARNQPLPPIEVANLQALQPPALYSQCAALFHAGWTLQAIGDSLLPPRSRSTVRSWVGRHPSSKPLPLVSQPVLKTPPEYVRRKPVSPGIAPTLVQRIQELAPQAKRYRATMSPNSSAAEANRELTDIVRDLHRNSVTVSELAAAAGVTYRAMARRLGKLKK